MNTPNRDIPYVPEGTLDPAAGLNLALDVIDAVIVPRVISMAHTAPPGLPSDGDLYVPASPATGAWAGLENYLVRYRTEGAFWQAYAPGAVYLLLNQDDLGLYKLDDGSSPGTWTLAAGLGDAPNDGSLYARRNELWEAFQAGLFVMNEDSPPLVESEATTLIFGDGLDFTVETDGVVRVFAAPVPVQVVFQLAVSDLATDLTTGTAKAYFRAPHAFTVTAVRSSLIDASSSGLVTVDINDGGTTILSTKLSIDATEKTSTTAATPAVISDTAIADDAEITIDIDAAGTDAKGLIVTIIGTRP